jgi:hypothetical protein
VGELFLKLAAKYCHNMDKGNHTDIFEPIQPSGAERAMQHVQAAIEANPTEHITLHLDSVNAFNTADRAAQSNRGDYTCSSSSSCNVAGFSLGVVAVVAGMFQLLKVRTQALCPWKKRYQTALLRAC